MDVWVWIVIAVAVVIVIALFVMWASARRRHRYLEGRFGSEYGRTVDSAESRRKGERELREREAEHSELDLRPLTDAAASATRRNGPPCNRASWTVRRLRSPTPTAS